MERTRRVASISLNTSFGHSVLSDLGDGCDIYGLAHLGCNKLVNPIGLYTSGEVLNWGASINNSIFWFNLTDRKRMR